MNTKILLATLFVFVVVIIITTIILTRSKREGLIYLNQYELGDHYHNQPDSWPVTDTATTAWFKLRRQNNSLPSGPLNFVDILPRKMKSKGEWYF